MAKAKKSEAASSCCGCNTWAGWVVLIAGVLWLLSDLSLISWWKIGWHTVAALVIGLGLVMKR